MLLNEQIGNLIDRNGVSSVLEAVITKLQQDVGQLKDEYPNDCMARGELDYQLVTCLPTARRIQN